MMLLGQESIRDVILFPQVASRVVCKSWERVLGPMLVHTIKDAE
jgi:aspartyl-tRNA synthetase